jgi:hypothetical protein
MTGEEFIVFEEKKVPYFKVLSTDFKVRRGSNRLMFNRLKLKKKVSIISEERKVRGDINIQGHVMIPTLG